MKICMPTVESKGMDSKVHGHFGSAPFFAFYDVESGKLKMVQNTNEHHEHGACQPVAAISGEGVGAVVTGGMGRRAIDMFNQAGIKVFLLDGETVDSAAANFKAGKLVELKPDMACAGHGCH
ncbi:MAG: NifB/NifX family molybdenum-iron cluster-binding protein [Methanobacteriota archaeon]